MMPKFPPFLILVCLCTGAIAELPCGALLDSGDTAYARFDNRSALVFFSTAYQQCPERYDALMKMTRAFMDAGEDRGDTGSGPMYRAGMRYADTMQKRYPDSIQSYFLKAVAAGNLALITYGRERMMLGRIAGQNAEKSIDLSPSFAPAYLLLGIYYREIATVGVFQAMLARVFLGGMPHGTLEDAELALRKALELSPCNVEALLEYARTAVAMDNNKEAIAALEKMQFCPNVWHSDAKIKKEGLDLLEKLRK
jgi:tetratricopeptide (TPR) repeat protein